jgi:RND family efflux transporter MFP subunit
MKMLIAALAVGALLGGTGVYAMADRRPPPAAARAEGGDAHAAHGEERQALTTFTAETELYMEYPLPVANEAGDFALHFTRLADFKPVDIGAASIALSGGEQPTETFPAVMDKPGIFRARVIPKVAGRRTVTVTLRAGDGADEHRLGEIDVHGDDAAAKNAMAAGHAENGGITVTKEIQWKVDFATEVVQPRFIRQSVAATATIRARAADEAVISAPGIGTLAPAADFPHLGQSVEKGQILAYLVPQLGGETDSAALELDLRKARLALDLAAQERQRLEGLLKIEAIPERRVIEARNQEATARAQLDAAAKRAAPYQNGKGGIALRAPITGRIAAVNTAPGAAIQQGQPLFHLANFSRLWLEARIPEAQVGRILQPSGGWFIAEGYTDAFVIENGRNGRLVALGGVVDKESRTVPALFEFDNPGERFRIGMYAQARIYTGAAEDSPAVPASAILDDNGAPVVFVQTGGESFERRPIVPGLRDGDHVAVREGVSAGERIVSRGAYQVKLAAAAPASLSHGHAH